MHLHAVETYKCATLGVSARACEHMHVHRQARRTHARTPAHPYVPPSLHGAIPDKTRLGDAISIPAAGAVLEVVGARLDNLEVVLAGRGARRKRIQALSQVCGGREGGRVGARGLRTMSNVIQRFCSAVRWKRTRWVFVKRAAPFRSPRATCRRRHPGSLRRCPPRMSASWLPTPTPTATAAQADMHYASCDVSICGTHTCHGLSAKFIVSNERFLFKIVLLRHAQLRKPKNEALIYHYCYIDIY